MQIKNIYFYCASGLYGPSNEPSNTQSLILYIQNL